MPDWGVVGVVVVLAGLATTLVTPMLRLNTTMTRLVVLVEELSDKLSALEHENGKEHSKLSERIGSVCEDVHGHETRITVLEKGGKKNGDV